MTKRKSNKQKNRRNKTYKKKLLKGGEGEQRSWSEWFYSFFPSTNTSSGSLTNNTQQPVSNSVQQTPTGNV